MTSTVPAALADQRIAVLDVEGNGGQPPEIIEIAVLTMDDDVTRENLRTCLVRPCHLITDRTLVAHNASVEHKVLSAHLPAWQPSMILDTLRLARHVWPGLPSYSLDQLIAHAALDDTGMTGRHHRAGWDTWMTGQLLLALVDQVPLDWPGLVTVASRPGFDHSEGGLW